MAEPTRAQNKATSFVRSVARPLVSYLDHRFDDLRAALDQRFDTIERRVADPEELQRALESAQRSLREQTDATRELATAVEAFARSLIGRADDLVDAIGALVERAEQVLDRDPHDTHTPS